MSSIALAFTGRADEAVALADEGLRHYRQASDVPQLPEVQLIGRVFAHAAAGRLAQAEADGATGEQACLAAGDLEGHATGLFMTGLVLVERGHVGRAASIFRDAASVNRNLNELAALRWCLSGVALAEAMSGHADEARAAAAERDEMPVGSLALYETDLIGRSRAWECVAAGEQSRAREILTESAAQAAASKLCIAEARLLHDIARLGRPDVVATRLGRARAAS